VKYEKLHDEIKIRFRGLKIEPKTSQVIVLSQQDYDVLFGDLLAYQQKNKDQLDVDLVGQLNSYINTHRQYYNPDFRIKYPSRVIRPSPPLRENNLTSVHEIETIDKFVLQSLSTSNLTDDELLGRLLYSAVRHGGLVNKPFLTHFLDCVCQKRIKSVDDLIWFELHGAVGELHNWFPDNLTILLIKQFFDKNMSFESVEKPEYYILKFLQCIPEFTRTKLNLTWLFLTINARLSLSITPFALNILTAKQINVPLKEVPLLRLITQKSPRLSFKIDEIEAPPTIKEATEKNSWKKQVQVNYPDSEAFLIWIRNQLIEAKAQSKQNFKKRDLAELRKKINEKLEIEAQKITPIVHILVDWIMHSLEKGSKWSRKLKLSSILSYLASIGRRLQHQVGYKDPTQMDIEELAHIYLTIIDDGRNIAVKERRARILRDFHEVLEQKYQVKPCYIFQEFIAAGNENKVNLVDANILMPWEYETATAFLTQSNEMTGLTEIQRKAVYVALILGFRCGFRRSELHYLKIQDFEWDLLKYDTIPEWATILISYSEVRDLKSISAHRRLPIGLLLNKEELYVLNDYCRLRLDLTLEESDFLFYFGQRDHLMDRSAQVVDQDQLFTPLTTLLQRITGDDTFRFHHLRHSFATWLFWYWTADIHKFSHPIPTLRRHRLFDHLFAAREYLIHRAPDLPSRKTLHLISAIIGHSGPSITLFHYIHSAIWCVWSDLQQQLPDATLGFNNISRAAITSVTTRTLYRKNEEEIQSCGPYFDGFLKFINSELAKLSTKLDTTIWQSIHYSEIETLLSKLPLKVSEITLYKGLLSYFNKKYNFQKCISMYSLNEQAFSIAVDNAFYFFSQRQSRHPHGKRVDAAKNHTRRGYINTKKIRLMPESKVPLLPIRSRPLNFLVSIIRRYQELSDSQRHKVLLAAKYIVDFCSVDWSDIRISLNETGSPNGKEWLKILLDAIKLLDIDGDLYKYVRLTLVCRHELRSSERESWWQTWTEGLSILNRENRYNNNYPKKARIHLDVMDFKEFADAVDGKRRSRSPSKKLYRVPSQEGFITAMYIIFFVHYSAERFESANISI